MKILINALSILAGIVITTSFGIIALMVYAYDGFIEFLPIMFTVLLADALLFFQIKYWKLSFVSLLFVVVVLSYLHVAFDFFDFSPTIDEVVLENLFAIGLFLVVSVLNLYHNIAYSKISKDPVIEK